MPSLCHLPTSLIFLVLTLSWINTMAPLACIERALTLVGLSPTCGTEILKDSRSALVKSMLLVVEHLPFLDTSDSGVHLLEPFHPRFTTRLMTNATAQARGCLVFPCLIHSPLTPFFCVVDSRLTKLAVTQV